MAPYQVHIVALGESPEVAAAVNSIEAGLEQAGIEVLVDDRAERPGVKFKDADLVGIPLRVTVGEAVEFQLRPRSTAFNGYVCVQAADGTKKQSNLVCAPDVVTRAA